MKGNVVRLEQSPCSVEAQPVAKTVLVRVRKSLSPEEARALAVELLHAADSAEFGDGHESWFGYEATDSADLGVLRTVIDRELGDLNPDQEYDGDYAGLIELAAKTIKAGKGRGWFRVV